MGVASGAQGTISPKFLAYLVILSFEKRRPKQKYCCSPNIKHFGLPPNFSPKNFWVGYATAGALSLVLPL